MKVGSLFESLRERETQIEVQFRDENESYICDTIYNCAGMIPYLECEIKDWDILIRQDLTKRNETHRVLIVMNIYLETPEQIPTKTEDVIKEAEAIIKESKDVIKQAPKAAGQKDFAQAPKKEKICELCGKPFHPNSGVQKYCASCKKLKEDIKKTAQELLEG